MSISTETLLPSALALTRSMVPVNCLKPPSCFPVTFDPVNSTFEFSDVIGKASPLATAGAAFAFDTGCVLVVLLEFETIAFVLLAAGSSHAAINNDATIMIKEKY